MKHYTIGIYKIPNILVTEFPSIVSSPKSCKFDGIITDKNRHYFIFVHSHFDESTKRAKIRNYWKNEAADVCLILYIYIIIKIIMIVKIQISYKLFFVVANPDNVMILCNMHFF